jgi:hypothetical protein
LGPILADVPLGTTFTVMVSPGPTQRLGGETFLLSLLMVIRLPFWQTGGISMVAHDWAVTSGAL